MAMAKKHYRLLSELEPRNESDVKTVIAVHDTHLATGSRDKSVNLWKLNAPSDRSAADADIEPSDALFTLIATFAGHDEYVNSLAHIPTNEGLLGLLASGGNSSLILLHNLDTLAPEAEDCLIGHTANVCALSYSATLGKLASCSWDCTARVWSRSTTEAEAGADAEPKSKWACEVVLEGHEQAVWDCRIFETGAHAGCYITGSGTSGIAGTSGRS